MVTEADIARRDRLKAFDRAERINRVGWVLVAMLAIAVFVWWHRGRPVLPIDERVIGTECKVRYSRVMTPADSLVIDMQAPVMDPETAPANITCGELRRAGKLPR